MSANNDMMFEEIYHKLSHAIGVDAYSHRFKNYKTPKLGKDLETRYRNRYVLSKESEDLEYAVVFGLAEKYERLGQIVYCVTKEGFKWLRTNWSRYKSLKQ